MSLPAEILYQLYTQQKGRGLDNNLLYYKSRYNRQRGGGLGSIFGSIGKYVVPWLKNVIWPAAKKYALPHAKQAALNLAEDVVIEGKNIADSFKDQGKKAIKGATQQVIDQYQSGGVDARRRKRVIKRKAVKRKRTLSRKPTKRVAKKQKTTHLLLPSQLRRI